VCLWVARDGGTEDAGTKLLGDSVILVVSEFTWRERVSTYFAIMSVLIISSTPFVSTRHASGS
jgi:hypothetical protein